ncbi:hypothetical protein M2454_002032 [Aequitasia blattaphilus]|uniref:DUF4179 domain-containing protein n=1 Tax=Aequitasia blattaphilus TaxID=2949332 RepID=A0ABT1EA59_9FIRM|nr:hypothetical protein [Aequitasia blattaphilus]MCP1102718.1 hypothetical protein [Aequitasia blattaphilus]MCR8615358.1 hypothetical protein [Aequitasia blattaphilus]
MNKNECTLCGGKVGRDGKCVECGFTNRENSKAVQQPVRQPVQQPVRQPVQQRMQQPAQPYQYSQSTNRKPAKKKNYFRGFIAIVAIIVSISKFIPGIIRNYQDKKFEKVYESINDSTYEEYDPYMNRQDIPVGDGKEVEYELAPGMYTVGVHLEEGQYRVDELPEGGSISVTDRENGIFLYESTYTETTIRDDIRLFKGAKLEIYGKEPITFKSDDVKEDGIHGIENPLTEEVLLTVTEDGVTAGKDFEPGVYDIVMEGEGRDGVFGIYSSEGMEAESLIQSFYFYELENGEKDRFNNYIFPEGYTIVTDEGRETQVRLVPSKVIQSTDYGADAKGY